MGPTWNLPLLPSLGPAGPPFPELGGPCWTLGGGTRVASRGLAVGPSGAPPSQQALLLGGARTRGRLVTHPLRMARSVPAALPADSLSAAPALPSRPQRLPRALCRGRAAAAGQGTAGTGWAVGLRPAHCSSQPACRAWRRGPGGRGRRVPAGLEPAGAAVRAAPRLEPLQGHGGLDPEPRAPSLTLPPCPGFPACAAASPTPTSRRSIWEPRCTAWAGLLVLRPGAGAGVGGVRSELGGSLRPRQRREHRPESGGACGGGTEPGLREGPRSQAPEH